MFMFPRPECVSSDCLKFSHTDTGTHTVIHTHVCSHTILCNLKTKVLVTNICWAVKSHHRYYPFNPCYWCYVYVRLFTFWMCQLSTIVCIWIVFNHMKGFVTVTKYCCIFIIIWNWNMSVMLPFRHIRYIQSTPLLL